LLRQRTIRLVRGHLVVSGIRDRSMAAMQAVKDQQRRRTVEKRRQPCGVFVSEGPQMAKP
jgi:hypothetical protein